MRWLAAGLALGVAVALVAADGPAVAPAMASTSLGRAVLLTPGASGVGDPYYPQAGNGGYDVESYRLRLRYDPSSDQLTGDELITATATQNLSRFNLDLGSLRIDSLSVNGRTAEWSRTGGVELAVTVPRGVGVLEGTRFTVELRYAGAPDAMGEGFGRTPSGAIAVGEPQGATTWYAVNDHPLDKATYQFEITVPDGYTAIANGVPQGTTSAAGQTTWRWSEAYPMASYLATVAIGRYRVFTGEDKGRPFYAAVASSVPASYADDAIRRTPEIIDFLSTQFGPYPFDAIGGIVPDADQISFALETQTRPVYAPNFFRNGSADDKTTVIAHELAHQWFGDSVSVHYWRDIWLNEGFATYAQWLWDEHLGRRTAQQAFDNTYAASVDNPLWKPPPGDPGEKALFGASVYRRGAMTLQALRVTVGDEAFFAILRAWASEHRYGNATTADFVALAERVSGRNLRSLFQAWLFQSGKPPAPKPAR
jgi:aminopeptidase N